MNETLRIGPDAGRVAALGVLMIAAAVLALAGWAVVAPLSGAVIAPGFVKVDLNRKVVQHQEGGIVRAIRVRDGDRVSQGQALVLLEDVRIEAQLDLLLTQLDAEHAKAARLEAERAYAAQPVFPASLANRATDTKVAELLGRETALFRARRRRSRRRSRSCGARSGRPPRKQARSRSRSAPRSVRSGCKKRSSA